MGELQIEKSQTENTFELGNLVGRHEALGLIASRCSAADAATLRRIRDKELWRSEAASWNEFCGSRLRMTRSNANRLIKLLEDFGPAYFQISHAAPISAAEYRNTIAPAVRDNALHVNGEAIALTEENDPRIAEAISELRKTITVKAIEAPSETPFRTLERHCSDLMDEFSAAAESVADQPCGCTNLESIVLMLQARLSQLETQIMAARRISLRK